MANNAIQDSQGQQKDESEHDAVEDGPSTEKLKELGVTVERKVVVTYYDEAEARCGLWGNSRWRS